MLVFYADNPSLNPQHHIYPCQHYQRSLLSVEPGIAPSNPVEYDPNDLPPAKKKNVDLIRSLKDL